MLSNCSVIMKQRAAKKNATMQRRKSMSKQTSSTIGQVIGIDAQKRHKRTASAPASSPKPRRSAPQQQTDSDSQASQGWFSWVGSFFYDVMLCIIYHFIFSYR